MNCAMAHRARVVSLCALAGCSDPAKHEPLQQSKSFIELSQQNQVFALATSLREQRDPAARAKEAASLATGALLVGLLDASSPMLDAGSPMLASNGTQVRATCGVTFVSPSYAITAAHCASEINLDLNQLVVEMYRPTPAIAQGYLVATALTGSFPDFSHARMDSTHGYFVDRYPCQVVSRCGRDYGSALNCDADVNQLGDVALLKCDNRPGDQYGFLEIASQDDPGAEVFMPWKHEIYDVDVSTSNSDQFLHYVLQSSQSLGDNYHYHGLSTQGVEQNQLLPLVSINFSDGSAHSKVDASDAYDVVTDLVGCHGTSGSGALQLGDTDLWQLLGPARYGDAELNEYLCDHIPTLMLGEHLPGTRGISYAGLAGTQHVYLRNQTEIEADCSALTGESTSLFTHLNCCLAQLRADPANADFANRLVTPNQAPPWEYLRDPLAQLGAGESTQLSGFQVIPGQRYRFGLNVGCSISPCPRLTVSIQGTDVLSLVPAGLDSTMRPAAASFTASATGTPILTFRAEGSNSVQLGGISLRPDSKINHFDTAHERLEVELFDLARAPGVAQPMRFVGDGGQGFAAQLLDKERLLLTRQAIAAGRLWTIRFDASPATTLSCGFLDASGQVAVQVDCSLRPAQLDDRNSVGARAGFFIQSPDGNTPVTIDNVQLQSDVAVSSGGASGLGGAGTAGLGSGGSVVAGGSVASGGSLAFGGYSDLGDASAIGGGSSAGGSLPAGDTAGDTGTGGSTAGTPAVSDSNKAGSPNLAAGATSLGGNTVANTGATTSSSGSIGGGGCQCESARGSSRGKTLLLISASALLVRRRRRHLRCLG